MIKKFGKYLKEELNESSISVENIDEWEVISDWASDGRVSPKYNVSYNTLTDDINDFLAYYNGDLPDENVYINTWKERYNLNEVNKSVIRKLENEIWLHLVSQAKSENAFQEYVDEENKRIEKLMLDIPENYIHVGTEKSGEYSDYKFYHKGRKETILLDDWEVDPITNKIHKLSPNAALLKHLRTSNNKTTNETYNISKEDYIATLSSDSLEHIVKDYFEGRDILFTIEEDTKIFINMNTLDYPKMVVLKELQKYLKDTYDLNSKIRDVGHKTKSFVLIVPIQTLDRGVSLMEGIDYSSLDTEQKEYLDELNDSDTEIFDMRDFEHYADKIGVSLEELMSYMSDKNLVDSTKKSEDLNESHLEFNIKPITDVRKGDLAYNLINHTPAIVLKPNHTDNIVHIIELYKEIDKNVKLIYDYLIQEGDFKQIEEICTYVHKDGMRISDKESAINSMKSVQADVKQFTDSEKNDFLYRYKDVLKDAVIDAEIFAPIKEVVYNDASDDDSVYVYDYKNPIKETNRMVESFERFTYINENKDYLRQIAKDIKKKYKDFKFSIRVSYNKISISILEAPIELRLDTSNGNEPVNHYYVRDHYKENPEAKEVLADIADMALSGQKEKSYDGDYGSIPNYYVDLEVGKWDKPFKVVEK